MMSIQIVIFDFDGTLADSFDVFVEGFNAAAALYNFLPFDIANIEHLRSLTARDILNYHGALSWKLPLIVRTIRKNMGRSITRVGLFNGIGSMLARLRHQGVKLAILTSNSRSNVELVLGLEKLNYFDHIHCGTAVFGKARKLKQIARQSGLKIADVLFIGDEIRDVHAARDAGIPFMSVGWGYTEASALLQAGARVCFDDPEQISHHLLEMISD